ncbi:hypothetical protein C4D60_Mb08t21040 [Musa balbisiana]|uniref:Uncharacterized protein n=1 Tax=Musa balbisiana TaxID=52838 RepID=A0A4S8K5D2_MUSBA|nr:hypothetical protein C4D60_Mb08t21040 [Musa balbisiana]
MAEEFGVGSLQLPSELLDDVFVTEREERRPAAEAVEPVTESASDEEGDYLAGLARQMAHSFLLDDDSGILGLSAGDDAKKVSESVKPSMFPRLVRVKAPLILRRTSPLKHRLTARSSRPCSPLEPPKGDAWDPLHEAAEQTMWSKLTDAEHGRWRVYEHELLSQPRKPCTSKSTSPFLARHQLQAARQQLSAGWERQIKARRGASHGGNRCALSLGSFPSGCPPFQMQHRPQQGSGMRAVFLRSSGARKESIGTGVFLPRTAGSKTEPQKKSAAACSTVFIPARVVQALNLNLEAQTGCPGGFVLEQGKLCDGSTHLCTVSDLCSHRSVVTSDALVGPRNPGRHHSLPPRPSAMTTPVSGLPQEWTY